MPIIEEAVVSCLGAVPRPGPRPPHPRGRALREARERPRPLLRLRAPLPVPPGATASAACASTRAACSRSRRATWPASTWTPSRRSPSSTPCPAPRRSRSACSAATCTAGSARTGSRRRRCATRASMAPAEEVTPEEIVRRGEARRRAHRDLDLQRAAHHERVGGRPSSALAKAAGLLCSYVSNGNGTEEVLEYLRPVGLALQGGPQGLPRPPLPRARRHAREGPVDDPGAAREGVLGRGGDARRARAQRLGRGAARHRALPGVGVAGHPVARDRVPPGLQDGRTGSRRRVRSLLRAAEIGRREGLRFVYAGNLPGAVRELGEHLLPGLPRAPRRARSASASCRTGWAPTGAARSAGGPSRGLGSPDHCGRARSSNGRERALVPQSRRGPR